MIQILKDQFAGMASAVTHHNSTGGAAQRWAVADQQKSLFMGNLETGGPLDAPVSDAMHEAERETPQDVEGEASTEHVHERCRQ